MEFDSFSNRFAILEEDAIDLQNNGTLAVDPERSLPLWFDGRFLTARDLTRQQQYFHARQNALGRTVGRGVIEGLDVSMRSEGSLTRLEIGAGQGVAFDGAHIVLPTDLSLDLSDLAVQSLINAKEGLSEKPGAPISSRTGLFVLALRAVEYTANPTPSSPTHITDERTLYMGDKVEAVAATLTEFTALGTDLDMVEARSAAAHRIFHSGEALNVPSYALPLAMISLRHGIVEWIDTHMVRRELVASRRDFLGIGLNQEQLRLAHFHQYQGALNDVMSLYADRAQPARFPAEQHFGILPPAGPMPAAALDPANQTQVFFPGEVEVELSIIPDDELPALIEESFDLPPIDLTLPVSDRDNLSIMIVAPMPRSALRSQLKTLEKLSKPLKPLGLLGQGPLKPLDRLGTTRISLADVAAHTNRRADATSEAWANVVRSLTNFNLAGNEGQATVWYMRRRTLRRSADLESVLVAIENTSPVVEPPTDPEEPAPVEDPVVPPTDEPEVEPLSDEARAALLVLSGTGDLQSIVEAEMRRVTSAVQEVMVTSITETTIPKQPISITAFTARISESNANAATKAKEASQSLQEANAAGTALLSTALIGRNETKVSFERFKELLMFTAPTKMLETYANALSEMNEDTASEVVAKLMSIIDAQDEGSLKELTEALPEITASNPRRDPTPVRDVISEEEARRRAAEEARLRADAERRRAEAEARRRREAQLAAQRENALIASLPVRGDQTRMRTVLGKANADQKKTIVDRLSAAKVNRSRVATEVALRALSTGGSINDSQMNNLRVVSQTFVTGMAALEKTLLKVETAAPSSGGNRPRVNTPRVTPRGGGAIAIDPRREALLGAGVRGGALGDRLVARRDLTALVVASKDQQISRRVGLVAGASNVRSLAEFGHTNRSKTSTLKKMTDRLIPVLDKRDATSVKVSNAIRAGLRGGR